MNHWSFATDGVLIAGGIAVWLVAASLCWQNFVRRQSRATGWLEGLRLIIVTVLVITLFRPEFVQRIERSEAPEIAVLVDVSGSMATEDVTGESNVVTRAQWIAAQRQTNIWAPLEKIGRVVFDEFSPAPTNANADAGTDLTGTLETTLKRYENLRAVLMLTDGDWNLGGAPAGIATRYRERDVPIFSVAVGSEKALPDILMERVSMPAYGLIGEQIALPFKVRNHLPREVKTTVSVMIEGRAASKKEITIPAHGQLQDAILWSPRAVGEVDLKLSLPVDPEERIAHNNEMPARISVRAETLRVLVVDSLPRWEYRYLRNALMRDPGVEMHSVLFLPGIGMGGGQNYLDGFPGTKEQLASYDVVFLGDVGIGGGELTDKDVTLLKGLVEQQSSGLVFLPGRRGRHLTLLNSDLGDLMPVVLTKDRETGVGLQNEVPLLLSSTGQGHLLTRFDADEARNADIWKNLPGFYWNAAVEKSRPGSEVLGVHASMRNAWGRIPLLVTRPAGNGKVLFMGTDSAWRWRRGVEDKFHYRFWSQVVRWMAHQRHLAGKDGIRLSYTPEAPNAGETVFLQTTVLDAGGFPLEKGEVTGRITGPDGQLEDLEFESLGGGWGVFKTRFTPRQGGEFKVEIESRDAGRKLDSRITVTQPTRELVGQPANHGVLRELASITGGELAQTRGLTEVLQAITLLPEPKPLENRIRLWANPWWGGLILLLLTIYWTGRKLAGMI